MYVYNIDSNEGGDLTLHRQHRLDEKKDEASKGGSKTDGQDNPAGTGTESGKYCAVQFPSVAACGFDET